MVWETSDGSPSGASARAYPDYAEAVQTVAVLRTVPASERADKQQRLVEDKKTAYWFDDTGTGADDGDLIIKPTDVSNGGRWFKIIEGGTPTPHAASHAENAADEIVVENLGTASAAAGKVPVSDGAGGLNMKAAMDYICMIDDKTPSAAGGDFLSGAWRTRDLTVEQADTGNHAALASNQITLQPGKYAFHISAPAYKVNRHQTALYDVTDTVHALIGSSEDADTIDDVQTRSVIAGFRSFGAPHTFEVQHRCETNRSGDGFGLASGFGLSEVYTVVEIWRLGDA